MVSEATLQQGISWKFIRWLGNLHGRQSVIGIQWYRLANKVADGYVRLKVQFLSHTSHISSVQQTCIVSGHCIIQCRHKTVPSP